MPSGVSDSAAKHVAIAAVRTHGRAARAPGKRASGDGCHGRLVGCVQVVAEGIPAPKLPVAALNVVLHRVAIGTPSSVADEGYASILCLPFHRSIYVIVSRA